MLYKTKTVLELTGFKRDKFNQWLAKRIIIPEKLPRRKGDRSGFSYDNLVQFLIVERLASCGINISVGAEIARGFTEIVHTCEDIRREAHIQGQFPITYLIVNVDDHDEYDVVVDNITPYDASIVIQADLFYSQVDKFLSEE